MFYHKRSKGLLPNENEQPKFSQIYFTDGGMIEQTEARMNIYGDGSNEGTRREIVQELAAILETVNPYVNLFRQCREIQ